MYLDYFKLKEKPFQLTPDSDYLYMSHAHTRAMAYMDYSTWNSEGFVVITGGVGAGKTILLKKFLTELTSNILVAKIFQTQLDEVEFLQAVLVEFGLTPFNAKKVELMDMLNSFLIEHYASGKQIVLLVDDAQNLSPRVLEEIRMLSCLETNKEKILHIILLGQPELNQLIESPDLEQLMQRVRLRFHISSLTESETEQYIKHRLKVAGNTNEKLFSSECFPAIHRYTGGVPRLVNSLCDTALTCAYADDLKEVSLDTVKIAVEELQWIPYSERKEKIQSSQKQETGIKKTLQPVPASVNSTSSLDRNTKAVHNLSERLQDVEAVIPAIVTVARELSSIRRVLEDIKERLSPGTPSKNQNKSKLTNTK